MSPGPVSVRPLPAVPRTDQGRVDVDRVLAAVTAAAPVGAPPYLLETVPGAPGAGRWSYVVAGVRGRLIWWPDRGASASGVLDDGPPPRHQDPFGAFEQACARVAIDPHAPRVDGLPPFTGGLVGGFSYDLARAVERVSGTAAADRDLPWFDLAAADLVVAIDHHEERALLLERPLGAPRSDGEIATLVAAMSDAPQTAGPAPHRGDRPPPVSTSLAPDAYAAAVRTILDHIAAGDTFQVNLTQRLTTTWRADVVALYRALRTVSPAPYGAVVPAGAHAVASISPETFLHLTSGHATVRPIKGTRPRARDPRDDERLRDELAASAKDRAENVMVVDMERNDLGRVCVPGSVTVGRLCDVEAHPTVWHLVSEVSGRLRPGVGYAELLRATFPCGSVTGTPKVRALDLIDRYEPVRRGWYCGSIGFLADGAASLSVAIRTATLGPDGRVDYGAGGGVVADSDPVGEHAESLDKAAAFLRAVGAAPDAIRRARPSPS